MAILLPNTNVGMTRFHKHFFIYLSILTRAYSYVIKINGEVSFDMQISDFLEPLQRTIDENDTKKIEKSKYREPHNTLKIMEVEEADKDWKEMINQERVKSRVTAAPVVECLYQYPDMEQFNAMLSNMMNELTKVFIRIHKMMDRSGGRRDGTRFTIVEKLDTNFFEDIYTNMTTEYRQFYNNTTERVSRTAVHPCENQEELKAVWVELIERSLSSLRRAAQKCIDGFLRTKDRSDDRRTKHKLEQYLVRELSRIRSRQLHMLCDSFQLCYNELI